MTELFHEPAYDDVSRETFELAPAVDAPQGNEKIDVTEEFCEAYSAMAEHVSTLTARIESLEKSNEALRGAVNQFGVMLDSIVQNVAGFSNMVQQQGIPGLIKQFMGGGNG